MSTAELVVVGGSVVLILGQLWVFLVPRATGPRTGVRAQEIRVLVKGEFNPDVITVEAGPPCPPLVLQR